MKRAEVNRDRGTGLWIVSLSDSPLYDYVYPTHAAALAHALAEVGLTPTNPEKEQA